MCLHFVPFLSPHSEAETKEGRTIDDLAFDVKTVSDTSVGHGWKCSHVPSEDFVVSVEYGSNADKVKELLLD